MFLVSLIHSRSQHLDRLKLRQAPPPAEFGVGQSLPAAVSLVSERQRKNRKFQIYRHKPDRDSAPQYSMEWLIQGILSGLVSSNWQEKLAVFLFYVHWKCLTDLCPADMYWPDGSQTANRKVVFFNHYVSPSGWSTCCLNQHDVSQRRPDEGRRAAAEHRRMWGTMVPNASTDEEKLQEIQRVHSVYKSMRIKDHSQNDGSVREKNERAHGDYIHILKRSFLEWTLRDFSSIFQTSSQNVTLWSTLRTGQNVHGPPRRELAEATHSSLSDTRSSY